MSETTSHARACASQLAYDQRVVAGMPTAYHHLIAGSLASDCADAEYIRAGEAGDPGETRMYLRFADEARALRDAHERAACIAADREDAS